MKTESLMEVGMGGGTAVQSFSPVQTTEHGGWGMARKRIDNSTNGHLAPDTPSWSESSEKSDVGSLHLNDVERAYLGHSLRKLTAREREVVYAICAGGTNEETAERLSIAVPTLRTHLMRLNQKCGTACKGDIVRFVAATLIEGYRAKSVENHSSTPNGH